MLFKGGSWLGRDGTFREGDVRVIDALIVELAEGVLQRAGDEPVVDCVGCKIFPGAIDAHVHFREPGLQHKEGIENGCRAAIAGGVTTVLEMPNTVPPCSSRALYDAKRSLFLEKAPVNWGLFFEATSCDAAKSWPREFRPPAKLYMAKSSQSSPVNRLWAVQEIFSTFPIVAIHAEDETRFIEGKLNHHEARPRLAVSSALDILEQAWRAANPKPRLILCHIATLEEVNWVVKMRACGADVFAEVCPHYLMLTQDDYRRDSALYKVNPPLRTAADGSALQEALKGGVIDFLSTDHAPHLPEEKKSALPPSGIASIEWYFPLALHLAAQLSLSFERVQELICGKASEAYEIANRNGIAVGNFADLVVVEHGVQGKRSIITRAAVDPYSHLKFETQVRTVVINGNLIFSNGNEVANRPALEVFSVL